MDKEIEKWQAEVSALLEEGRKLELRLREIRKRIKLLSTKIMDAINLDKWEVMKDD